MRVQFINMYLTRNQKLLLLSSFPFFLAGTDNVFYGNWIAISLNLAMGGLNLLGLFWIEKYHFPVQFGLSLANSAMAFTTAWLFKEAGKEYLPLIWLFVGLLFLFTAWNFWRKWNAEKNSRSV